MAKLNSAGACVYGQGAGVISIDGLAVPELASYMAGGWAWLATGTIAGQASLSGGPWKLYKDVRSGPTITVLDASGANSFGAGTNVWAAFLAGSGVRRSVGSAIPAGSLADVSPDGQVVAIDSYLSGTGLTVYDAAGASLFTLPGVQIVSPYIRLRNNYLAYQDTTGWHLVNVTTGQTPVWFPRTDSVNTVIPVLMGSVLWVVEANNAILTARAANKATGYQIETTPVFFNPDAVASSSTVLRMAYCNNQGETTASLLETDLTIATGANTRGVVSGGSIVRTPGTTIAPSQFQVGPQEGSGLTGGLYEPRQQKLTDASGYVSKPWGDYFQGLQSNLGTVSTAVQNTPTPTAPGASFGVLSASGQTPVAASAPNDTLTLTSTNGSVLFTANPATKAINLATASGTVQTTVTLTNAQIKALPTTSITAIAAPGAGFAIRPIIGTAYFKIAGAYTNIDAAGVLGIRFASLKLGLSFVPNDTSITNPVVGTTLLSNFLGAAANQRATLVPTMNTEGVDFWGPIPFAETTASFDNQALLIDVDNNGAGNFTGGNAANTITFYFYYAIEPIP